MKKILIYLKSFFDFIILKLFQLIIRENKNRSNNLLFINTGQIGDLVISSAVFENDIILNNYERCYFLIDKRFVDLFEDYTGTLKIITINITSYKYNILYRFKFNNSLRKLNINTVYNLTSIRTTWNDNLALAIGAKQTYCYKNSWKTLIKVFADYTDKLYTGETATEYFNEYDKIENVIKIFRSNSKSNETKNKTVFVENKLNNNFDIIIAPFSSLGNRDIRVDIIDSLTKRFNTRKFLILCSKEQKNILDNLDLSDNVTVSAGKYKLSQLYSIINNSNVFIGVDTGLTHIALKTKTKVIVVIGKGNYDRYLPKPNDNETVYLYENCEYSGCEWYCKKDKVLCVENVSADRIIDEISIVLGIQ